MINQWICYINKENQLTKQINKQLPMIILNYYFRCSVRPPRRIFRFAFGYFKATKRTNNDHSAPLISYSFSSFSVMNLRSVDATQFENEKEEERKTTKRQTIRFFSSTNETYIKKKLAEKQ